MKKLIILLILLCFSFSFFSCNKKKQEESIQKNKIINDFFYEYTNKALLQENNYYLPESINPFLNRYKIQDGLFFTVKEIIFPAAVANDFVLEEDEPGFRWIDALIIDVEEERIAEQLLEMEQRLENISEPINEELSSEEKQQLINEYISTEIKDVDQSLSYMEYGKEFFFPVKQGDNYILINSSEENVSRAFYDNIFRCYKEEKWKINGSDDGELITSIETDFRINEYIPLTRKITEKKLETKQNFNEKGYVIKEEVFHLDEDGKIINIKSSLLLKYNKDNKLIDSLLTEYYYKDEDFKKLSYVFEKNYRYKYNNNDIPADFDYYENDTLKISRKYSGKDSYISVIYFDGDYSVTSYYKNNKLLKEEFCSKGNVERVNNYEK